METIFQVISLTWALSGGQFLTQDAVNGLDMVKGSPYFATTEFELQVPLSWQKDDDDLVFLGGSTETQFIKDRALYFAPWQDAYTVSAGLRLWGMELGYEHQCVHPVKTLGKTDSGFYSMYDKFYFKIEGKM